jgi:hypothetical protein
LQFSKFHLEELKKTGEVIRKYKFLVVTYLLEVTALGHVHVVKVVDALVCASVGVVGHHFNILQPHAFMTMDGILDFLDCLNRKFVTLF